MGQLQKMLKTFPADQEHVVLNRTYFDYFPQSKSMGNPFLSEQFDNKDFRNCSISMNDSKGEFDTDVPIVQFGAELALGTFWTKKSVEFKVGEYHDLEELHLYLDGDLDTKEFKLHMIQHHPGPIVPSTPTPPKFPEVTVWQPFHGNMQYVSYNTILIANEIKKNVYHTIYEFQPKDPHIWVPIKDPMYKLKDKGIYCLDHSTSKTIVIENPSVRSFITLQDMSSSCTGKDIYEELSLINPDLEVTVAPTTYKDALIPGYTITKETNLPLVGFEKYRHDPPGSGSSVGGFANPTNPAPTKRKCPEIE